MIEKCEFCFYFLWKNADIIQRKPVKGSFLLYVFDIDANLYLFG